MASPSDDRRADPSRGRSLVRSPLLHPMFFAAFPVLFLWSENLRDDISFGDVAQVLGLVIAGTAGVRGVLRLFVREPARASLAASALVLVFLSFGHLVQAADPLGGEGDARLLFPAFILLAAACVVFAVRSPLAARSAPPLNFVAAGLVLFNLIPIVAHEFGGPSAIDLGGIDISRAERLPADRLPDIYYVVFDRYGAEEVLREQYGFDNREIVGFLRGRGFDVSDDAVANYPRTTHSLSSTLNMRYLDDLAAEVGTTSSNWAPLFASVNGSVAPRAFQQLGYRFVNIGTFWEPTRDVPGADVNHVWDGANEFASVFELTTMWPTIAELTGIRDVDRFRDAWERTERQLDVLDRIPDDPRPTFTFAHFALPHPPYVFRGDGSYAPPGTYPAPATGYLEQLRYANVRIRGFVDQALAAGSGPAPIVVFQSDEGPNPDELTRDQVSYDFTHASQSDLERKLRIFQAAFLPGEHFRGEASLGVTPVNTFRVILNRYFHAQLPILPDRVYVYRNEGHPYEFHEVTDRLLGR